MARAYSDDLRRKLLEAHQQGEGSLEKLAARFRVSVSWAKDISATLRRTGKMERPPAGPRGPKSKLTAEVRQQLREWIAAQPDLTLMEMQERLDEELSLKVSIGRLWTVLGEMNLRLKKSHSMRPNRTPKRFVTGVSAGSKQHARSIPRD
jgi:transposase